MEAGRRNERKRRKKTEEGKKRRVLDQKGDVICSKSTFLTTHGRAYCSEEAEGNSGDPTLRENTGHR